jgi:hypothetical protein
VSLTNPENGPFSGKIQKMDPFSVKCQKFSGLGFTDAIQNQSVESFRYTSETISFSDHFLDDGMIDCFF